MLPPPWTKPRRLRTDLTQRTAGNSNYKKFQKRKTKIEKPKNIFVGFNDHNPFGILQDLSSKNEDRNPLPAQDAEISEPCKANHIAIRRSHKSKSGRFTKKNGKIPKTPSVGASNFRGFRGLKKQSATSDWKYKRHIKLVKQKSKLSYTIASAIQSNLIGMAIHVEYMETELAQYFATHPSGWCILARRPPIRLIASILDLCQVRPSSIAKIDDLENLLCTRINVHKYTNTFAAPGPRKDRTITLAGMACSARRCI
jgi:hypothetical protein